jgi:TonB family protein
MILTIMIGLLALFAPQEQPQFRGGARDLGYFLSANMIYPEYSRQNCLQGTVEVSFWLTGKGKIYRSSVNKGFGTDLDKEALRLVRLTSGKWKVPAAFDTTLAIVIPVSFSLKDEQSCAIRDRTDRNAAIAAYRARESLTAVITNFYANKEAGRYDASQEGHILELKEQLGYDEKFIDRMVKQGASKLKQGDKEGACEDFTFVKHLGSNKADKQRASACN